MQFRAFLQCGQIDGGAKAASVLSEGVFRTAVAAVRQQKARVEQQAAEQGQIVQQASARHALQQAVEKCGRLAEFARDVEEAVATGNLSALKARATTIRGVATGLLELLRQLGDNPA